ncbi:DUF5707 domain-containing protein [Streptomyces atroolivaceus]|uniref:DUF5707 domain-containing protein n=1 Tax=Streptomyces atroolivaceus TaxID=66869 RepID=UPI0033FFFC66
MNVTPVHASPQFMTSVYMPLSRGRCFVEDADSHLRGLGPRRPVGDGQEAFGGRFTGGSSDCFAPPIPLKAAGTPRRLPHEPGDPSMSKRVLLPSLLGAAVIGAVTTEGLAMASTATEPTVKKESVHYVAPEGSRAGSLTFTAKVHDDSGVRGLKVLVCQHRARSGQGGDARRHAPRAAALPAAPLAVSAR